MTLCTPLPFLCDLLLHTTEIWPVCYVTYIDLLTAHMHAPAIADRAIIGAAKQGLSSGAGAGAIAFSAALPAP